MSQTCPNATCLGGEVKGRISLSSAPGAKPVFTYAKIPFGKPPLLSKRFMRPEPADPWKGVLDGTVHSSIPMQSVAGTKLFQAMSPSKTNTNDLQQYVTEDCLQLTVYTTTLDSTADLPVMVFLYGGFLQMGFSDQYNGTTLAGLHDVVIVVPNYRVGVFGFFTMDDPVCPGNCGLFDQLLALQWVRDNIHCFGGSKSNVTIFGESAGATAVDQNVNSPLTAGLFGKAITESGQATNAKLYQEFYYESRALLLKTLDISADQTPANVLSALQKVPAAQMQQADEVLAKANLSFYCNLDGEFIVRSPWLTMQSKTFNKVSYLIGCNDSEYKGQLPHFDNVPDFFTGLSKAQETSYLQGMPRMPKNVIEKVIQECYLYYDYPKTLPQVYSQQCGELLSDYIFNVPAVNTAKAHMEVGSNVYSYYATFQPRYNHDRAYGPHVDMKPEWCRCDHGDCLNMVFGVPFNPGTLSGGAKFTEDEVQLSLRFMKFFTQFAKTGTPNYGAPDCPEWPSMSSKGEYMVMNTGSLVVKPGLKQQACMFWNQVIRGIMMNY